MTESAAPAYLTFMSAWCSRRKSALLLSCRCMAMCSKVCPSDMVSLMQAPEPSSWAAIVCMPGTQTGPDCPTCPTSHGHTRPLHFSKPAASHGAVRAYPKPTDEPSPSTPPSLPPPSDVGLSGDAGGTTLPVHNARPSTVWSRESLRLKSGIICKLLVA